MNEFGDCLDRQALIERYILWHLETCGRAAATNAQPISFTLGRLAGKFCNLRKSRSVIKGSIFLGAKGIEDWAAPLPEASLRLKELLKHTKRVVVLESLISSIVIQSKDLSSIVPRQKSLKDLFAILVKHSPIGMYYKDQYSMSNLFKEINDFIDGSSEFDVIFKWRSHWHDSNGSSNGRKY